MTNAILTLISQAPRAVADGEGLPAQGRKGASPQAGQGGESVPFANVLGAASHDGEAPSTPLDGAPTLPPVLLAYSEALQGSQSVQVVSAGQAGGDVKGSAQSARLGDTVGNAQAVPQHAAVLFTGTAGTSGAGSSVPVVPVPGTPGSVADGVVPSSLGLRPDEAVLRQGGAGSVSPVSLLAQESAVGSPAALRPQETALLDASDAVQRFVKSTPREGLPVGLDQSLRSALPPASHIAADVSTVPANATAVVPGGASARTVQDALFTGLQAQSAQSQLQEHGNVSGTRPAQVAHHSGHTPTPLVPVVPDAGSAGHSSEHTFGQYGGGASTTHHESPNANQSSSAAAVHGGRALGVDERFTSLSAGPQRLQIDVQLSEAAKVHVDVSVQQRHVYAGLMLDNPALRQPIAQNVHMLDAQLGQADLELEDLDVQVDQEAMDEGAPSGDAESMAPSEYVRRPAAAQHAEGNAVVEAAPRSAVSTTQPWHVIA